jgi:hypothetical protein
MAPDVTASILTSPLLARVVDLLGHAHNTTVRSCRFFFVLVSHLLVVGFGWMFADWPNRHR